MLEEYINKIICGDSKDVLKNLPECCVDLVFTSPPYNFNIEYDSYVDQVENNSYMSMLFPILDECYRVLKDDGRLVINIQPLFSKNFPTHHIISNYLMSKGMIWGGEILWEKNTYNCPCTCWGSWKSPSSPYLKYTWEFLEVFYKKDRKKIGNSNDIDITGEEFKLWTTAKWTIAPEKRMNDFGHPAMFPEELANRVLKLFSYKNDFVLDPFNGGGTTCVLAKRTGRRYLGIDISKDYCELARRRVANTPIYQNLFL